MAKFMDVHSGFFGVSQEQLAEAAVHKGDTADDHGRADEDVQVDRLAEHDRAGDDADDGQEVGEDRGPRRADPPEQPEVQEVRQPGAEDPQPDHGD
jgi:hypothetical protein